MQRIEVYYKILSKFGEDHQKIKAIEELNELGTEIAKDLNGNGDTDKIIDELADAWIMLEQLRLIYPDVSNRINYKIKRMIERYELEK
jgi:hypothetical protein